MTTVGAVAAEAVRRLREAGIDDPRREAWRLVADLAQLEPGTVALRPDTPVSSLLGGQVEAAVTRRAAGEPLAYVSGWAGFRHLTLAVDRRVLIPRPETEGLVDLVLSRVATGRVVDVGTGSGCIALSLAAEGRYTEVVAIDRSSDALAVARANAARLGLPVRFLAGDLLEPLLGSGGVFDAVVSNPPYLSVAEYAGLDRSVRDWEPRLALESGEDGLAATRRLFGQAWQLLRPGGIAAVEVDHSRAAMVAALARSSGGSDVAVLQDPYGRDRYVVARREAVR